MPDQFEFWIFLAFFLAYVTVWARIASIINGGQLGGSKFIRQLSYRIMGVLDTDYDITYSSIMAFIYYLGAILGILVIFLLYGKNIISYLYIDSGYIYFIVIGSLAEISLTGLINGFFNAFAKEAGINTIDEIRKIKWITGISLMPKWSMSLVAAFGGFFEEIIFRGVFMIVTINQYHIAAWIAIILSVMLFLYHQIIQLDTPTQKCIIGSASVIISVVGALMVVHTGSILPAVLAHTSFVIFYTSNAWIFSNDVTSGTKVKF